MQNYCYYLVTILNVHALPFTCNHTQYNSSDCVFKPEQNSGHRGESWEIFHRIFPKETTNQKETHWRENYTNSYNFEGLTSK